MGPYLEKARLEYFFRNSQSRKLRRKMARDLMKRQSWQEVKDEFPPYNKPMDLGIKKLKKTGASYKDVLQYKLKVRKDLATQLSSKEA